MRTQKERLMSIFKCKKDELGIRFEYVLEDANGIQKEFSEDNKNIFKHTKWLFSHKMDDNLVLTVKKAKYRLISAEMIDWEDIEVGSMQAYIEECKRNGQTVHINPIKN